MARYFPQPTAEEWINELRQTAVSREQFIEAVFNEMDGLTYEMQQSALDRSPDAFRRALDRFMVLAQGVNV